MKFNKTRIIIAIPILVSIAGIIVLAGNSFSTKEIIITGIVESKSVDIASKIPGRVEIIIIKEGDLVKKGDTLAVLESKEMNAKVEQAKSAMQAAESKLAMVKNGARSEEKEAVSNLYEQSKHQFEYVSKTWARFQKLYKDSVISAQEKDGVEFQYKSAREQMEAAKAKFDMVIKGARTEEISAAEALYNQVKNAYIEAMAYFQELTIKAPISGEISNCIVDEGEVISSGYPIFSLMVPDDSYIVLQVREDQLPTIKKGNIYMGKVAALANAEIEFEVTYIASMADFATWKPTNQKGEFDLKMFEVHLRSKHPVNGLRPGMTVNIKL